MYQSLSARLRCLFDRNDPDEPLDRSAVLVRRRRPYLDWLQEATGIPEVTEDLLEDGTVYLLPPADEPEDLAAYIDAAYPWIFEHQLSLDIETPERWPGDRSWERFQAWFEMVSADMVLDLGSGEGSPEDQG